MGVFFGFLFTSDSYKINNDWDILFFFGQLIISIIIALPVGLILVLLDFFLNDGYIHYLILLPVLFFSTLAISYFQLKSPPSFNFKKELKKRKKQLPLIFEKYSPIIPNEEVKNKDTTFIIEKLGEFLTKFNFGDNEKISAEDASHYEKVDRFIGVGFALPRKQIPIGSRLCKTLLKAANTLEFKFLSYSPNGQYFVCYFSFRRYASHLKRDIYSSRIVFGEKVDNEIHLFQYKGLLKYKQSENEDDFKFFTGWKTDESIMYNLDKGNLSRIFDYPKYNPMEPLFWEDPNFFSSVNIDGIDYTRFKTLNQNSGSNKVYPYQLREKLVLK